MEKAPAGTTTEQPSTTTTSTEKPEGRVHTGDVLRQLEAIERRQTTVERELGIVAAGDVDEDTVDDATPAKPRSWFEDVERDLWGDAPAAAPAPAKKRAKKVDA